MRPYLRAANVTWNGLALGDVKEMNFSPSEVTTFRLTFGDILLSEASGSASEVGKPAIWRDEIDDCCFQNTLLRVRTGHLEPAFLLWFFKWLALSGQFARGSRGVGIHHLGAKALSEWNVPVAPRPEQKRIVAAIEEQFSRLDAGVSALDRARRNLKRMREAILHRVIGFELGATLPKGWKWVTIRDVAGDHSTPVLTGPFGTALSRSDFRPDGVPVLTIGSLTSDGIQISLAPRVSDSKADTLRRYTLRSGDVLFSRMATVGRAAVVGETEEGSLINYHLMRLRLDQTIILPEFLVLLCRGSRAIEQYLSESNHGVTRAGINTGQLLALPVALPSISEQERIVNIARSADDVGSRLEREAALATARAGRLRSSILAAAFSGSLVPQDPTDKAATVLLEQIAAERVLANGREPRRTRKPRTPPEKVTV
jgi:type I restriction enzyme S subunit